MGEVEACLAPALAPNELLWPAMRAKVLLLVAGLRPVKDVRPAMPAARCQLSALRLPSRRPSCRQ